MKHADTPTREKNIDSDIRKDDRTLASEDRAAGQRYAVLANVLNGITMFVVVGAIMMLYANDVLKLSPRKIASILALLPLLSILQFPFLNFLQRFRKVNVLKAAVLVRAVVVLTLLLLPARSTTFPVYLALLLVFGATIYLGTVTVWPSLMRDITTTTDRGRFFARMRFCFSVVTAAATFVIPLMVGKSITEMQYKILLAFALIGPLNFFFWVRRIPEIRHQDDSSTPSTVFSMSRIFQVIRTSPLFRRPILVILLTILPTMPIYVVYLKQLLHIPSNVVSAYISAAVLGQAVSLLLWGKINDSVGYKPMLMGLLIISCIAAPFQVFIMPMGAAESSFLEVSVASVLSFCVLILFGFTQGAVVSGIGIARTSVDFFNVKSEDAMEALNVSFCIQLVVNAILILFLGEFLQKLAIPWGTFSIMNGKLHFDAIKIYMIVFSIPVTILAMWCLSRLPNTRPSFGTSDFFTAFSLSTATQILEQRHVFHEDEERRVITARWFGQRKHPFALDSLLEMLTDPSYDVKVEAIRSLAITDSPLAGEKLLELLQDESKRHLADHAAWALGELKYGPAYESLVKRLAPEYPQRLRAMAARALGKIGNPNALPPLVEVLTSETDSQHVLSSACRGILRLHGVADHAELIFKALARLTDREERFEIMDAICGYLDISNEWIVRSVSTMTLFEMLQRHISRKSHKWHDKHAATIKALNDRDHIKVTHMVERLCAHPPFDNDPVLQGMRVSLSRLDEWQSLSVLACAWLLLRR